MTAYRLVDRTLFAELVAADPDSQPTLRGGRCAECATVTFPFQDGCPRCGTIGMEATDLPAEGELWSFTVQGFEPKAPYRGDGPFEPYGVGYLDLGDVLVESILTENDPNELRIGNRMRLRLVPSFTDPDGTVVLTFAFAPVDPEDEVVR
ncbi:Zn-ribbon domain-containing OB-fold protein [Rhodococcus sp. O3]|uniref:Zn-ribbon domain-containing OB-fold protein n=1 Tax=Rhodococcus sp. O3 TaxID=3404919 RepID=UPI003B66B6DB